MGYHPRKWRDLSTTESVTHRSGDLSTTESVASLGSGDLSTTESITSPGSGGPVNDREHHPLRKWRTCQRQGVSPPEEVGGPILCSCSHNQRHCCKGRKTFVGIQSNLTSAKRRHPAIYSREPNLFTVCVKHYCMAGRYKAWAPWINHGVTICLLDCHANVWLLEPQHYTLGGVGPPALYTWDVGPQH